MKRFLLSILCCLMAVVSGFAEEYSYTFTAKQFTANGKKTLNNVDWTLSGDGGGYWGYDGTKGQQFGSGSAPYMSLNFSTDDIPGTIESIVINTSGAKSTDAKLVVTVGGVQYGTQKSLTASATDYTFTGASSGEINLSYTQTGKKAIYIKSITVTYKNNSSEPSVLSSPKFTPTGCEFSDYQEVTITAENGAVIYYTLDGSAPTKASEEYDGVITLTETTTVKAFAVKDGYKDSEVVEATYTKRVLQEGQVEDVLTREWTGIENEETTYSSWSDLTSTSSAKYSGNSAGSNDAIQLRSDKNNSGIVTTVSGGKVKKIIVEWQANTSNGRTLKVYGKNGAYTAPTDLYGDNAGTTLGTIVKGTSTELEITGDFTYVGLRSNSGAMYLTSITIIWDTNTTQTPTAPAAPTINPNSSEFVGSQEITISAEDGATIYYTTDGSEPQAGTNKYTAPFTITGTTTVKAIAVNSVGASDVATATYTRVAANPTIAFGDDATFEEQVIANINVAPGDTAYYTLDETTPTNKSTKYTQPLTIKASATLQVIAYDKDGYKSDVVKQAFTHKSGSTGGSPGTATLVTSIADIAVGDQVVIVASGYDYALSTNQKDNNRGQVAITKNGDNVTLEEGVQILTLEEGTTSGNFAFYTGSGYLYAASSSSNYLRTQATNDENGSWNISIADGVATIKAQGTNTRNWLRYNSASNNGQLFSCYGSGQQNVSLYKVNHATVEPYILNVSAAGWATLFLDYNAEIPEGVTCYVISKFEGDKATLTEVTGVLPKGTGVIVKANPGDYTFVATDATADVESNLSGSANNEYVTEEAYVLSKPVNGEVGLYKAEMAGGVFLNNANKAYLPASALTASAQGASGFKFRFDNQTTGIEGAPALNTAKAIYDLSGRKVNDITAPGLYIVNGKKVMVK